MTAAIIAAAALVLILSAGGWYFSSIVIKPKRYTTADSIEIEKEKKHLVEPV